MMKVFFTGKLLGCFLGKCFESIKFITKNLELPMIASCDEYVVLYYYITFMLICIGTHTDTHTYSQKHHLHMHMHMHTHTRTRTRMCARAHTHRSR